jgi:hypothetical protein
MLKLPGLNEVECVETDGQYEIEVTVTGDAPECGCLLPNLRKNGQAGYIMPASMETPVEVRKADWL